MNKARILVLSVFIVSMSLRLTLSLINRQANDDHMAVINWMVDKQEIPSNESCWECFQPKAFYLMHAGIISMLHIQKQEQRIVYVQLINLLYGFFILFFLWKFISRQGYSPVIAVSCFALLAFNPCLTGINVQATNDTLAILAGILTIYFVDIFFKEKKISAALSMIVFAILASLVKGSGIIIMAALLLIFSVKLFSSVGVDRKFFGKVFFFLIVSYSAIVPFAGGYYENFQKYDTPFAHNHSQKDPPPLFYERTIAGRPGITSVVDGYFTFRYLDMIRMPYIPNNDERNYPLHRTSLWSQLYGRTFFMHFDQWPNSWVNTDWKIITAGRLLIILGIFPLLLFLTGLLKTAKRSFHKFRKLKRDYFSTTNDWIHLLFLFCFFLFIIKYTYDYRDFSTMKSIFLFPALPVFVKLFMDGFSMISSKRVLKWLLAILGAIVMLSIYDIGFLIAQLSN